MPPHQAHHNWTNTEVSETAVLVQGEELNPFIANAESFAPYAESISALGNHRRNSAFGPAATIPSTAKISTDTAIGSNTDTLNYEYTTLYTAEEQPVQVRTPWTIQTVTAGSGVVPPSPTATLAGQLQEQAGICSATQSAEPKIPKGGEGVDNNEQLDDNPNKPGNNDDPGDDGPGSSDGSGGGNPGGPQGPNISERDYFDLFWAFQNSIDHLGNTLGGMQTDSSDSGKPKVKEPEVFDGSDPRKLFEFLVSLSLVFLDHPSHFTDQKKIAYALSYLSGAAWEWFELDILDPNVLSLPNWTKYFLALVKELQDNFGLFNAEGDAEDKFSNLWMRENELVWKYNIHFNTLVAMTNWDNHALKWAYQRGLASWIKDEMACIVEPPTLTAYQVEVLWINNWYWHWEEEKKREVNQNTGSSNKASNPNQQKKGSLNPSSSAQTPPQQPKQLKLNQSSSQQLNSKGWSSNKFNKNSGSGGLGNCPPQPHDKHLGPNGKLKPEEFEHRKKFNLCMFCSGKHKFEDCDQWKQRQSCRRAANTQESSSLEPSVVTKVSEN